MDNARMSPATSQTQAHGLVISNCIHCSMTTNFACALRVNSLRIQMWSTKVRPLLDCSVQRLQAIPGYLAYLCNLTPISWSNQHC